MKKFLSLLLSALLAVSFVVSASAAENVVDDGVQERTSKERKIIANEFDF